MLRCSVNFILHLVCFGSSEKMNAPLVDVVFLVMSEVWNHYRIKYSVVTQTGMFA